MKETAKVLTSCLNSNNELTLVPGGFHGAYVLRTLGSSHFKYDSAKKHLMNLDFEALGSRTMHFNTVVEGGMDGEIEGQTNSHGPGRLMRLATWVNLDSSIAVGPRRSLLCVVLAYAL